MNQENRRHSSAGFVETTPAPRLGVLRGDFLANRLASTDNLARTTKRKNTYQRKQENQLSLTNRATRSEVTQGHWKWYHSIDYMYGFDYRSIVTLSVRYSKSGPGPWRSFKLSPFDREPISCRFWDIQCGKISQPWNPGQGSIKVIESCTIL